ncbi:MAG TPA: HXXEE domain-containing protein [Actinopolymorphaceae bacterium]
MTEPMSPVRRPADVWPCCGGLRSGRWHPWFPLRALHGDQTTFTLALGLVTLAVVVLAAVAVGLRPRWSAEVLVCLGCALLLNAASHLMLSLVSWSLMPGAITSAVVLLPVGIGIIRLLPSFRWTPTAVVVIALAMLGTVLGSLLLAAAFGASV